MRPLFFLLLFAISANNSLANASDKSTSKAISQYLKKQGPVSEKKSFFNADKSQLVKYFCIDENLPGGKNEGASNPANVHCGIALFSKKNGKWLLNDEKNLGQGSVIKFTSNTLITETVEYDLSKDALCCPSIKIEKAFYIRDGKFIDEKP